MASLNDILSAIQNGVVALNNLTKQMRGSFLNISGTLAGKANLVGGNTFTGGQIALSFVSDANPTSAIGVLDRGGSGNISLMYRSGVTTAFWNNTVGDVIRYDTSANVSMLGDLTFVGSAWTTTTPTPTAQTGAFTTVSATVKQKISGKTCTVQVTVIVTAVGTAAGQIL